MHKANHSGMDRVVSIPFWRKPFVIWAIGGIMACTVLAWQGFGAYQRQQMPVLDHNQISLTTIEKSNFADILSTNAYFEPASSTYLDASVSGIIEQIHVEDGAIVRAGDPVLTIKNPTLDMQIISERGSILDRMSKLDQQDLELQKSLLSRRSEIDKISYDHVRAKRELSQNQHLFDLDLISQTALSEARESVSFQEKRLVHANQTLALEKKLQTEYSARNLQSRNLVQTQLKALSKRAASLTVRASKSGILTGFDLELGQQLNEGARIATIGAVDQFRLSTELDEFYLDKISSGLTGRAAIQNGLPIRISQIKPTVTDGKFAVKFAFIEQPKIKIKIRRGQSVDISLSLSSDANVLILSRAVYDRLPNRQKIYVLSASGKEATLTTVRFGRKNKDQVEILSGLAQGMSIISQHKIGLNKPKLRIQ